MSALSSVPPITVSFTRPNEHYTICKFNHVPFVLFNKALTARGLRFDFAEHHLIILAEIEAEEGDLFIEALSVIVLNKLQALHGKVHVNTTWDFSQVGDNLVDPTTLHTASRDVFHVSPSPEHLADIFGAFHTGISTSKARDILHALAWIYEELCDPTGTGDGEEADGAEILEFFGIIPPLGGVQ